MMHMLWLKKQSMSVPTFKIVCGVLFGLLVAQAAARPAEATAGDKTILLRPTANPYALPANRGKATVRFSVQAARKGKRPAAVYLKRRDDKKIIAMNDLGKDGDLVAGDGIYGVNVRIDTARIKADSCLYYEASTQQKRGNLKSPPLKLCVSSFPIGIAAVNITKPARWGDDTQAAADEVLITVAPSVNASAIRELARSINANVAGSILPLNFYQLRLPAPDSPDQLLAKVLKLRKSPGVTSASVNLLGQGALNVNDAAFDLAPGNVNSQHGLKLVLGHTPPADANAANAWDGNNRGTGTRVVVMDTGLDLTHPDLPDSWTCQLIPAPPAPLMNPTVLEIPCTASVVGTTVARHGTLVAGVIAASATIGGAEGSGEGIAGVAFNSTIHSMKMPGFDLANQTQAFNQAAVYRGEHADALIYNASFNVLNAFAPVADVTALCGAINSLVLSGSTPRAIVVNSAGNNNSNGFSYPGRCNDPHTGGVTGTNALSSLGKPLLITVANSVSYLTNDCGNGAGAQAGIDQLCRANLAGGTPHLGSNYGAWVDIAAPGSEIRSTTIVGTGDSGGNYVSETGTTMAAPFVSGGAAILASCGVPLAQIEPSLKMSTNPVGKVNVTFPDGSSAPRLDVYLALSSVNHTPSGISFAPNVVNENSPTPLEAGTLTATDTDTCDKHTYTIVPQPGDDAASFNINGDKLNFNAGVVLNREAKASYEVTVHAVDFFGATPPADTTFTVIVNDIDEFDVGSVVDTDAAADTVIENMTGAVGLTVSASDADATNNAITYSLTDSAGGRFAIDPASGVVTAVGSIDREVAPSYGIIARATSSDGSYAEQGFTITIIDADEYDTGTVADNDPAANSVAESAGPGTATGVTAHASDADATNNSITYSLTDDAGGRFAIDPVTGVVSVAGALDYETAVGHSYGITVLASSSDGSSNSATFAIAVSNANEAPVANDDTLAATQDTPSNYLNTLLLGNDSDEDAGTTLSIQSVTNGTHGTVTLNGDNSVTFTPESGYSGAATFSYVATDGALNSNSATVTVNVAPVVPHPPVANNDTLNAFEDTPVTFAATDLTGNDTDADAGTTLAVASVASGAGGVAVRNPDGTVSFTPDTNFHGLASFTYTATDGGLASNVATVTVNVEAVNDPATGAPVITGNRTVGQTLNSNVSSIDDNDGLGTFHYQWLADGTLVGTDSSTILLTAAEFGKFMQLQVSYTDGDGTPETLMSALDAVAVGDPHITTVDGLHYDFQSAGEFVALRGKNGMEMQLRMAPVSTATPLTDPNSGLTSGVSVNTGLAARVGAHRVTYLAEGGNAPALRVDGAVTTLPAGGLDLGGGGRLMPQGNGIQIDFPDQTTVVVSSSLWSYYNVWWLHVSVFHTPAFEGVMGARKNGSWLPRLADGSAFGAMPAAMHDRYVELYVKFADSWRVSDKTSLFDYAEGTSTATYTNKAWPTENGPYVADSKPPVKPLGLKAAQLACRNVQGKIAKADCEFDVRVMGHQDVAMGHLQNQKVRLGATRIRLRAVDTAGIRGQRVYIATVVPQAVAAKLERRALLRPVGTVQFMLEGKPYGKPVKLDAKGQAAIKLYRLKLGQQTVTARFIPAKGSMFLPSISRQAARELKPSGKVIRAIDDLPRRLK
jgi:hypothetical protein